MNLNKVMLIGNLTRDPETKSTPQGTAVTSFSIATNMTWKDAASGEKKEKAEFHNIVAWRRLAEICGQYLKRGSKVYIEGRLQTRDWEGQDGVKHYKTEVIAENMVMLDSKGSRNKDGNNYQAPAVPANDGESEEEIKVEDIPF